MNIPKVSFHSVSSLFVYKPFEVDVSVYFHFRFQNFVNNLVLFRSWLNRRKREIEARKWGHTDTAHLIVYAPTWERGGGRQLPRSGITERHLKIMTHCSKRKKT